MTDWSRGDSTLDSLNRRLLALNVIQAICGLGFAVDLFLEFPSFDADQSLRPEDIIHLVSETLMLGLLVLGFALARFALRALHREQAALARNLRSLKGEFDRILHDRFDQWALSPAQRDVALLTLRGLRLSEIARARGSAEGTVKAQLGAVFRAAGVHTRGELTGLFMDEFLDFGAMTDRSGD